LAELDFTVLQMDPGLSSCIYTLGAGGLSSQLIPSSLLPYFFPALVLMVRKPGRQSSEEIRVISAVSGQPEIRTKTGGHATEHPALQSRHKLCYLSLKQR